MIMLNDRKCLDNVNSLLCILFIYKVKLVDKNVESA